MGGSVGGGRPVGVLAPPITSSPPRMVEWGGGVVVEAVEGRRDDADPTIEGIEEAMLARSSLHAVYADPSLLTLSAALRLLLDSALGFDLDGSAGDEGINEGMRDGRPALLGVSVVEGPRTDSGVVSDLMVTAWSSDLARTKNQTKYSTPVAYMSHPPNF